MRLILGLLMLLAAAAGGIYVGVVVCFVGGIVDILNQIKSPDPIESTVVAWGIAKVFFAGITGWVSGAVFAIPGLKMIKSWRKAQWVKHRRSW